MVTTFIRVTVIADDVQLDVSLPAHRPVIDFLPDVLDLLDIDADDDPSGWTLSTTTAGPLDPMDTLTDRQLHDGTSVHLTRAENAAAPPFVDDVLAEMTRVVDAGFARWTGTSRLRWMAVLSAGLIALVALATAGVGSGVLAGSALTALVLVAALLAGMSRDGIGTWMSIPASIAGALAAWRFTDALDVDARVALTAAAGSAAVAVTGLAARRMFPAVPVGGGLAVILGLCGGAFALGLSAVATAAWGSLLLLLALILAPGLALSSSGLLAQLRRSEQLELTARADIDTTLTRGRRVVDALVWMVAILAVFISGALIFGGVWQQGLIPAFLGLLLLMRSRSFAHSRHVGPLVAAGSASLLLVGYRLPDWLGVPDAAAVAIWVAVAAVILVGFVLSGTVKLGEVTRAEMRGWLDVADFLLMLAYVPIVVFAQGIYPYFWPS